MDYLDPEPRTNLQREIILKINEIINKMGPDKLNEWQLCPKCKGNGEVFASRFANALIMCNLCNGKKIISKVNGLPPQ